MGSNIGSKLADEFFARSGLAPCQDFRETAEVLARVAFKMFLGVRCETRDFDGELNRCILLVHENPLAEFVDLPAEMQNSLWYSNLLAGAIAGGLKAIGLQVHVNFVADQLRGDESTALQLEFKGRVKVEDED